VRHRLLHGLPSIWGGTLGGRGGGVNIRVKHGATQIEKGRVCNSICNYPGDVSRTRSEKWLKHWN